MARVFFVYLRYNAKRRDGRVVVKCRVDRRASVIVIVMNSN
jgi:hypothetical protein